MTSSSDNLEPVELLADEFMERQRRGEQPTIEEFCHRHPELADEIREVFPALVVMEQVAPASADLEVSASGDSPIVRRGIEQIGDFRILREIGRGGMGVVYEAEQQSLGRRVALKLLPRSASGDGTALMRFQREARAAARMHHTNIVPVFEVGQDDEFVFYAMQLIQGQGLDLVISDLRRLRSEHIAEHPGGEHADDDRQAAILAESLVHGRFRQENLLAGVAEEPLGEPMGTGPAGARLSADSGKELTETIAFGTGSTASATLPGQSDISTADSDRRSFFRSVAEIGLQTSRALAYAHARGIIHRDIKPSNLLLDTTGVVWITDFGLAKTGDVAMTHSGDILGTIRYMSPERFRGQCDVRADVYSLGLTLYELLTLRPAFESPDRLKLIEMVTKTDPPSLRSIDPRIPRDLETIVLKSIDKDPRRRYQSADDLQDDLQRFLDDQPIQARRVSSIERFARWSRRNPLLSAAGAVATAALIGVAAVSILFAREQSLAAASQKRLTGEQQRLNSELQQSYVTLEQSNHEREKYLWELQRQHDSLQASQARLAHRQGEYDIERGAVSEGMLWLAHSLQLAPADNKPLRNQILGRLSTTAQQSPRLRSIWTVPPVGLKSNSTGEGRQFRRVLDALRATSAFSSDRKVFCAVANTAPDATEPSNASMELSCWDVETGKQVGSVLRFEASAVQHFAISPRNRRIATIDVSFTAQGSNLTVWDIHTGEPSVEPIALGRNAAAILAQVCLFFSADGSKIHIVRREWLEQGRQVGPLRRNTLNTWDVSTGKSIAQSEIAYAGVPAFVTAPHGSHIGFVENLRDRSGTFKPPRLIRYDTRADKFVGENFDTTLRSLQYLDIPMARGVPIVPLDEDGRRIAVVNVPPDARGQRVEVWDLDQGRRVGPLIANGESTITAMAINDDATQIVVGSRVSARGRLVDKAAPASPSSADDPGNAGGNETRGPGRVRIWDIATGQPVTPPVPTDGPPVAVAFGVGTETFQAVDRNTLRTWELPRAQLQRMVLPGHTRARSPAMTLFRLSRSDSQSRRRPILSSANGAMAYANARKLITAVNDGDGIVLSRWNPSSGASLGQTRIPDTEGEGVVALSADARIVTTCSVGVDDPNWQIRCYNTGDGHQIGATILLDHVGLPVAVDNSGRRVVIAHKPNQEYTSFQLECWDLSLRASMEQELSINDDNLSAVRFLSESTLAVGTSEKLLWWNLTTGATRRSRILQSDSSDVRSPLTATDATAISHDGRLLARTRDRNTLQIMDLATGQFVGQSMVHPVNISDVAFSPDGRTVAVATSDRCVWQWSISTPWSDEPKEIIARVESLTGQRLDDQDQVQFLSADERVSPSLEDRTDWSERHFTTTQQQTLFLSRTRSDAEITARLTHWIVANPDDWFARFLRMRNFVEQGKMEEAMKDFQRASQLTDPQRLGLWISDLSRRDEFLTARTVYSDLSASTTADSTPHLWYLDRALELLPDSRQLRTQRVHLNIAQGRAEAAIKDYQRLVADDPDDHTTSIRLGVYLLSSGDEKAYRQHCNQMLQRWKDTDNLEARMQTALLCLLLPVGEEFQEALRLADEAFEHPEAAADARYKLAKGIAEYRRGDYQAVLRLFGDSSAQTLTNAPRQMIAAMAHHHLGMPRTAMRGYAAAADRIQDYIETELPTRSVPSIQHWICTIVEEEIRQLGIVERGEQIESLLTDVSAQLQASDPAGAAETLAQVIALAGDDPLLISELDLVSSAGCGKDTPDRFRQRIVDNLAEDLQSPWSSRLGLSKLDTRDWGVILTDDFERASPGGRWTTLAGDWGIDDGTLQGTLTGKKATQSGDARIELTLSWLPVPVEIQFETWWPEGLSSELKLLSRDENQGYIAGLSGYPHPVMVGKGWDPNGPFLIVKDDSTSPLFTFVARAPQHTYQADEKHHVRLLREEERLSLFVDGKQVLSRAVDSLTTPSLQLYGYGPPDSTVFFDNLKVRVPPQIQQRMRDARTVRQGRLQLTSSETREGLGTVTCVEVSDDGRFAYVSGYQQATINIFSRHLESGELTHLQEIVDVDNLRGATAIRLSPDGRYAVAAAFGSKSAVLYRRNGDGTLRLLDVAVDKAAGVEGLDWAVDAVFSPDSRFVYLCASKGNASGMGAIVALEITPEPKLRFVGANYGQDDCFDNVRGAAVTPDGKFIVATSSDAGTLVVLDRDHETGETSVRQIIRDDQAGVRGLGGAMAVTVSADSRFVYTSAGRFRGDSAVGVYQFDDSGTLTLVQELVNDESELLGFEGGNEITISPDGQNVYAAASKSSAIACFQRDLDNGKLLFLETIASEAGSLDAVAGVTLSPDGKYLYAAAERSRQISVFRRQSKRDE